MEDQYGEAGHSQDRQEHMGFGSRGGSSGGRMSGGGDAGQWLDLSCHANDACIRPCLVA